MLWSLCRAHGMVDFVILATGPRAAHTSACMGCFVLYIFMCVAHEPYLARARAHTHTHICIFSASFLGMCARVLGIVERQKKRIIESLITNDRELFGVYLGLGNTLQTLLV
jgi:hypothetical protein